MLTKKTKKIAVIGAGISGLAVASLLAKDGYQVTVLEKNPFLGGRASFFTQSGYFFDKGPSWYMMPEVFDHFFALFKRKTADFYRLKRLKIHHQVFFSPKEICKISDNFKDNLTLFEKAEKGGANKLRQYLAESQFIYENVMKDLVRLDYTSITQLLKPKLFYYLLRFNLFKNLHRHVSRYFQNKNLQKILEFTTVFLGGSPYNTPAFYSLVTHADFNLGIFYPRGGMHEIVKALLKLCQQYQVKILTDHEVSQVVVKDNLIKEVKAGRKTFTADIVICSADYRHFEVGLLPRKYQTYPQAYWQKKTLSPSAFIIYLGINKKLKKVEHHNLYFDQSWEDHFQDVYQNKLWPANPSYYVHVPSKTDPQVAPQNGETLMFLVPVAPGLEDNKKIRESFSWQILSHFENLIGEKITPFIKVKKIYAHSDFISEYNSYQGSAFGLAHTLDQTAILRPKNKSGKLKNLYYVGQYTNPGVGVPVCLLSAQIVQKLISQEYG